MKKSVVPPVACLAMTAHGYRAAQATVPPTVSRLQAAATPETAANSDAAASKAHVAHWRSFDVPGAVNGTQPTGINDLGEITGVYFDSNGNSHGPLRCLLAPLSRGSCAGGIRLRGASSLYN